MSDWMRKEQGKRIGSYVLIKVSERCAIGHNLTTKIQPYVTFLHNKYGEYGDAIFHSNLKDAVNDYERRTSLYQ